jgi:uncharacterized membrane protein
MALSDLYSNVQILLRWIHVLAGITWIGHLYFFNFVNIPYQGTIGADIKKASNPQLLPRALFWFRWGAMITFLAGLLLFTQLYMYQGDGVWGPTTLFRDEAGLTGRAVWILMGMTLGLIMWFNVWFIIWPAQQKIIRGVRDGNPAPANLPKRAAMASRINTYLSAPMLFGMLAPNHYGGINLVTAAIAILLGLAVIWHLYKVSPKVGTSI